MTELIRDGVLDAELAALFWMLVEARVPVVVAAGPSGVGKSTLLAALLEFLPAEADVRPVLGPDPDLDWLPEAVELGWRRPSRRAGVGSAAPPDAGQTSRADPARTVLVAPELSAHVPWYAWGGLARVLVRAASLGYGLATTVHAEALEDVFASLEAPPVSLTRDELGHLGTVVILRALRRAGDGDIRRRVVAAHLVRPPSRDVHGHVQRLGPAVLAAWDPVRDALDHYEWGVLPEIGIRLGRRAGDLGRAIERRAGFLRDLVAAGRTQPDATAEAIEAYRAWSAGDPAS